MWYLWCDGFAWATVDGVQCHLFLELHKALALLVYPVASVLASSLQLLHLYLVRLALRIILLVQFVKLSCDTNGKLKKNCQCKYLPNNLENTSILELYNIYFLCLSWHVKFIDNYPWSCTNDWNLPNTCMWCTVYCKMDVWNTDVKM